jgi:hypothetical protein
MGSSKHYDLLPYFEIYNSTRMNDTYFERYLLMRYNRYTVEEILEADNFKKVVFPAVRYLIYTYVMKSVICRDFK